MFHLTYGAPVGDIGKLIETKTVTIPSLMTIAPQVRQYVGECTRVRPECTTGMYDRYAQPCTDECTTGVHNPVQPCSNTSSV